MSSTIVYPNGSKSVTVGANESIAVYSKSACQVLRSLGYPNVPAQVSLLGTVTDGSTTFGPYTSGATIIINPGASPALYEVGLSPAVVEATSRLVIGSAPNALNATGTLTAAMLLGNIVTSSTGAAVAATLDTGAVMDTAADLAIGDTIAWSVINTGGNTFTVTASSGHTIVGVAAVVTVTSARFETRKTAAATYVTYRTA